MNSKNKFYFIKGKNIYLRPFKLKDISKKYLNWLNNPEINFGIEARFPVSELEAKLAKSEATETVVEAENDPSIVTEEVVVNEWDTFAKSILK